MTHNITITISNLSPEEALRSLEKLNGPTVDSRQTDMFVEPVVAEPVVIPHMLQKVGRAAPAEPVDIPPVATTAAPSTVEGLDATGLPWDERIHSGSKGQTAKGVWKRRRGLQDFQFDEVVTELRIQSTAPVVEVLPVAVMNIHQPVATSAVVAPVAPVAPVVPIAAPVVAPVAPVVAAPVVAPVVEAPARDFKGLMDRAHHLVTTQSVNTDYLQSVIDRINEGFVNKPNVETLPDIGADPEMVDYAWQCLEIDGKAA